jgi:RES domain-containing protein
MDLWRISNHKSLSGEGGLKYSARWHSAGRRIVYLAESPAGAMLEILVHLEMEENELPRRYTLLRVNVPSELAVEEFVVPSGDAWKQDHKLSRNLGNHWLDRRTTALARVPSALLPNTFNYLLNPMHADAKHVRVAAVVRAEFDPRLVRRLRN